jgi:hypothetical protein
MPERSANRHCTRHFIEIFCAALQRLCLTVGGQALRAVTYSLVAEKVEHLNSVHHLVGLHGNETKLPKVSSFVGVGRLSDSGSFARGFASLSFILG